MTFIRGRNSKVIASTLKDWMLNVKHIVIRFDVDFKCVVEYDINKVQGNLGGTCRHYPMFMCVCVCVYLCRKITQACGDCKRLPRLTFKAFLYSNLESKHKTTCLYSLVLVTLCNCNLVCANVR